MSGRRVAADRVRSRDEMSEREYVRLGLRLLDEQIVDATGSRVGRVEDLEFDAGPGQPARLISMLCGATAWKRRLPPKLSELFPDDPRGLRRVPLEEITNIENEVEVEDPVDELKRSADTDAAPMAVSQLIGTSVVDSAGHKLGRVRDVVASRRLQDGAPWEIYGLLIGWRGLLQRAGFQPLIDDDLKAGRIPENLIAWERVREFDDDGRLRVSQ